MTEDDPSRIVERSGGAFRIDDLSLYRPVDLFLEGPTIFADGAIVILPE